LENHCTTSTDKHVEDDNNQLESNNGLVQDKHSEDLAANFFEKLGGGAIKYVAVAKKPRKNISTIIAGKAITDMLDISEMF